MSIFNILHEKCYKILCFMWSAFLKKKESVHMFKKKKSLGDTVDMHQDRTHLRYALWIYSWFICFFLPYLYSLNFYRLHYFINMRKLKYSLFLLFRGFLSQRHVLLLPVLLDHKSPGAEQLWSHSRPVVEPFLIPGPIQWVAQMGCACKIHRAAPSFVPHS